MLLVRVKLAFKVPVSVAVVELNLRASCLVRRVVDRVVHVTLGNDGTTGHCSVGETLRAGDHIGGHVEFARGKSIAETAEASDDLVEDEQDVVLGADLADALQVALRRRQHTGTARNRLDDLTVNENEI